MIELGQLYNFGKDFIEKREPEQVNIPLEQQQREQQLGIEQKRGLARKRAREHRKMANIINMARQNIKAGNIIKVGG